MSADLEQASDLDRVGPVDFVVVAFPADRMTGESFPLLVDLVDQGVIRGLSTHWRPTGNASARRRSHARVAGRTTARSG
jgi:hypothetical protein